MARPAYPWYDAVGGDDLEQGDIFAECPVFSPPEELAVDLLEQSAFRWETRDVIVMSQSCDMVKDREKVKDVLLCAVFPRSELQDNSNSLGSDHTMEQARKGMLAAYHVVARSDLPDLERDVSVVEFKRTYSLPLAFMRRLATGQGPRLRLLPPYREHLAQAFARFFMRVGLPVEIPPFTGKRGAAE